MGFADIGVGAGDENAVIHRFIKVSAVVGVMANPRRSGAAMRRLVGKSIFPAFEAFFAIGVQVVIAFKVQFETRFGRRVEFTIVVAVIPAQLRSGGVNAAAPVGQQFGAWAEKHQEPAVGVSVEFHLVVRHLPE